MRLGRLRIAHLLFVALALLTLFLVTGCGSLGGPQNTFAPEGDVAKTQRDLFILVMIPALIIMIGVFLACIYIMIRFRRRESDGIPEQVHGNTRLELAWTIAPTILLIAIAIPTLITIVDLGEAAGPDAMPVTVEAIQWDWTFVYPEITDADGNILAAKELYVPVDQEINFSLHSLDVIHSFWVPKLAGKQDVIPGRTNHLKFKAEKPGTYDGQCAEFCGLNHAIMTFQTIVVTREEFDAWAQDQLAQGNVRPPPTPEPTPPGPSPTGGTAAPSETPPPTAVATP